MNINKLSKEAHENAKLKGFYDCKECRGTGKYFQENPDCRNCNEIINCDGKSYNKCIIMSNCPSCNGTGIDQNKNIPELLMLVITEIGEAVEALRCGKIITGKGGDYCIKKYDLLIGESSFEWWFERCIHSSFEDEIADVFIRLFDLCGYLEIEIDESDIYFDHYISDNITETLFEITKDITELSIVVKFESKTIKQLKFASVISYLLFFCEENHIDIEKHITAKMLYNSTRPKKHGKEF